MYGSARGMRLRVARSNNLTAAICNVLRDKFVVGAGRRARISRDLQRKS